MEENKNIKKNSSFNFIIIFICLIIIIIFIIFYIKKSSNNLNEFKEPNKINSQELLLEQIKKNKELINNNSQNLNQDAYFLDKNFFEDIKQATVINDIKNNVDLLKFNLKKYKDEDLDMIKTNIEYIIKKIDKNSIEETEVKNSIEETEVKNSTEKPTETSIEKPTEKPTEKSTEKSTENSLENIYDFENVEKKDL